jgi:ribosomal protein S3
MKGSLSRSPSTQFASQKALKLKVQKKSGTQLISKLLKIKLLKAKLSKLLQVKTKRRTSELEGQVLNSSTKPAGLLKKTSLKKRSSIISKMGSKLTKRQVKRQRTFKKRLRLRKFIRLRDRFLISKGLFIEKKENKIVKRISLVPTSRFLKDFSLNQSVNLLPVKQIEKMLNTKKVKTSNITSETNVTVGSQKRLKKVEPQILKTNLFNSRIRRKFVTIYIEQMKKRFLPHLNELFIKYTNNEPNSIRKGVSLGYLKKWDFNARVEILKTKPINQLERFVDNLREKFVQKLNLLRKEFITFGSFSSNSSEILGLFQFYNYLMSLKELVHDLKRNLKHKLKTRLAVSKISSSAFKKGSKETITELSVRANKLRVIESSNLLLQQKVSRKKLDQISNECRKMRFIEYLKDLVQKHRTDNIYLYLSSLSESRIKLKEIKNELKENLDFYLPGTNSIKDLIKARKTESSVENRNQLDSQINEQVNTVLLKLSKKNVFDKTFADCNFEDLERRKDMWLKNLKLIPQISIKFFSVNPTSLNQKASIVSEAVVDALEKRKAFRKVIKTTKEKLMRSPEIKGVKIQVAGRLNGAEIARAEWVRAGRVPLQTLRANLDYSYRTANTIYGIIGVKVWIFKGFTKLITKS